MELREAGTPAAGQGLLQAEAPAENEPEAVAGSRRSGEAGSPLHWFITVMLCASFLGLVRTGAPRPGREQESCREPCESRLP